MVSILSAIMVWSSFAAARPSIHSRQSEAAIEFCTGSDYTTGGCPESQPTSGSGTCGTLTVAPNTCCAFSLPSQDEFHVSEET